jgi:hypothetical protein
MAKAKVHPRTTLRQKLLLISGSILVTLFVAELLARLFVPYIRGTHLHPSSIWRDNFITSERIGKYHPVLGWVLQPNKETINKSWEFEHIIKTNSHGLRDDEVSYERQPNTRRILLLGDSFGMGYGVERKYSLEFLLEKYLRNTEVINLSVSGYGTDQELLAYEIEGEKYKADLVLLAFTIANDVFNNTMPNQYGRNKPYFELKNGKAILKGIPVPKMPFPENPKNADTHTRSPFPIHDFFDANSALYAWVFDRLSRIPSLKKRWEKAELLYPQVDVFYASQLWILNTRVSEYDPIWQLTFKLLERWQQKCVEQNAKPVLLLIPSNLQIYKGALKRVIKERNLNPGEFDLQHPNNLLKNFCKTHHLDVIDVLPEFQAAAASGYSPYFKRNPHWNRYGHLLAAKAVARELSKMEIFKK